MLRILALGDIVGRSGIVRLQKELWNYRKANRIDFTVANGENATEIQGLCAKDAQEIFDAGVDVITLGNHAFRMRDLYPVLEDDARIIRPANYPPQAPGAGCTVADVAGWRMLCLNVSGRVFLDPLASPFDTVDRLLEREAGRYDFALMDIHAEATSEKLAIAHWFDGRVQMMFGTHTHVPTADARILPKGSGYITDLGMCGPVDGILGTDKNEVLDKFRLMMPTAFHVAGGETSAMGAVFDFDPSANKVVSVQRVEF